MIYLPKRKRMAGFYPSFCSTIEKKPLQKPGLKKLQNKLNNYDFGGQMLAATRVAAKVLKY